MARGNQHIELQRRELVIGGSLAIIGSLAGCTGADIEDEDDNDDQGGQDDVDEEDVEFTDANIAVEDQVVDESIVVTDINIDRSAWVIVWPDGDGNGPEFAETETENPIAQAYLDPGETNRVEAESTVWAPPIADRVEDGDTLWVVLHYDDPRDNEFIYPSDDPPVEIDGEIVKESFVASLPDGDDDSDQS